MFGNMPIVGKNVKGIHLTTKNAELTDITIRASFSKDGFGTISFADENKDVMLQVAVCEVEALIAKAREVANERK